MNIIKIYEYKLSEKRNISWWHGLLSSLPCAWSKPKTFEMDGSVSAVYL